MRKMFSKNQVKELAIESVNEGLKSGVVIPTFDEFDFEVELENPDSSFELPQEVKNKLKGHKIFNLYVEDENELVVFSGVIISGNGYCVSCGVSDIISSGLSLCKFESTENYLYFSDMTSDTTDFDSLDYYHCYITIII